MRLRRELLVLAAVMATFPVIALLEPGDPGAAIDRARSLVAIESALGLDVERGVRGWFLDRPTLLVVASVVYYGAHVPVLIGVGCWLGARHPVAYVATRRTFVVAHVATAGAYVLLPCAPPRLLDGGTAGAGWNTLQYEFAAFPSGHVMFATVVALGIARSTRRGWLAALYPVSITLVTVATDHHYLLDGIAAVALTLLAAAAVTVVGTAGVVARSPVRRPAAHRDTLLSRSGP